MDEEPAEADEILRLYEARRAARRAAATDTAILGSRAVDRVLAHSPSGTGASAANAPPSPSPVEGTPLPTASPAGVSGFEDDGATDQADESDSEPVTAPIADRSLQLAQPPSAPALRPAVQGKVALSASAPELNLSDRLLDDRFITARGSRAGVMAGSALVVAGLVAIVAAQAMLSRGTTLAPFGLDVTGLGLAAAALGLALAVLFLFVPRRRSLRVRLAATQREEWARVQAEAGQLRRTSLLSAIAALVGLLGAAASYSVLRQPLAGYSAAVFLALAVAGIGVMLWSVARRGLVQRLYVQTLVLQRLEQTGLGPAAEMDPRIAPVLRSLDKLLGALPESAVRRFLASDEASSYLELIDELAKGGDGKDGAKDGGHGR